MKREQESSPQFRLGEHLIELDADLRCPWFPGRSAPEIIERYQTDNEPTGPERALQRTADLRFSYARVVAHRHFNDPVSCQRSLQDHLNCPAVGHLFEFECA